MPIIEYLKISIIKILSLNINNNGNENQKRILLFRNCFIGDFIVTIPALHALRYSNPHAKILLINFGSTNKRAKFATRNDDVYELGKGIVDNFKNLKLNLNGIREARAKIKIFQPNITIIIRYSRESFFSLAKKIILLRIVGVRCKIELGIEAFSRLKKDKINQVVSAWDSMGPYINSEIFLEKDYPSIRNDVTTPIWMNGKNCIALSIGTKEVGFNMWPMAKYKELVERLHNLYPKSYFIFVGSREDLLVSSQILENIPKECYSNLCGANSILDSFAILKGCKLAITLDSGPMHLAALAKCRIISIFSAYQPVDYWNPWCSKKTIIRKEIECNNCLENIGYCKFGDYRCITEIPVELVLNKCIEAIGNNTYHG